MARKVIVKNDLEDEDDDEETEIVQETSEEALDRILTKLDSSQDIDVFEELGARAAESGLFLLFDIYRDGSFLGRKTHPYSWPTLQKEFGGGAYRIDVKHPSTKKFVKKTSRIVHGESKEPGQKETTQAPFAPQNQNGDSTAMFGAILAPIMQMMTAVVSKPQSNGDQGIGQLLIQMQQSNSQQSQMMMQMFQNFAESSRKEQQSNTEFQSKLFEKMNDRIEKSLNNDKNGYTAGDILKATQDAQENGFKMYMMLQERAEVIADEKLALLPESGGEKEGGALDGILKAMAPLLMAGLAGQGTPSPQVEAPQTANPRPRLATPLRQNDIEFPRTQLPAKSRVAGATGAETPQARRGTINGVPSIVTANGFPRVDFDTLRAAKNRPGASASLATVQPLVVGQEVYDRFQNHWYPKIAAIIEPMITQGTSLTVVNVTDALDKNGFQFALFRDEIPKTAIEMIARQAPAPFGELFRGVYAASQNRQYNVDARESTTVETTVVEAEPRA